MLPKNTVSLLWMAGLGAVAILSLVFRFPAELAARFEPVTSEKPDFGNEPVIVTHDDRIFTLFAALNAAGFDQEYDGIPMHPIRQTVRAALKDRDLPSLARLKPIFDRVSHYHLVEWVLQRSNPPEFGRAEADWLVTTRPADFNGLADALGDFYLEADIPGLWKTVESEHQAEIAHLQPVAEISNADLKIYLRSLEMPFDQVVIIPNLLDSYYSGYGPQTGKTAYVIAGPTETDLSLRGLIEHEVLHSIIGPLLEKHIGVIPAKQADRIFGVLKTSMPSGYNTWSSALEETIIRAINLRQLKDEELRATQLNQLESAGFLLIRPIDQALAVYEKSDRAFGEYLPILLGGLVNVALVQHE